MIEKPDYRNWLREKLEEAGHGAKSRLAKHLGVSPDAVTRMVNIDSQKESREISAKELGFMANFFGEFPPDITKVDRADAFDVVQKMATNKIKPSASINGLNSIPDLAIHAGMGNGGLLDVSVDHQGNPTDPESVRGFWTFPDYMVRGLGNLSKIYAWEVRGDSMEPSLPGGSVVFVDTTQTTLPPDDIYALDYGDGLMVKRVKLIPRTNKLLVISDNERYGSDELRREDVRIYGRIRGWFQWRG